MAQRTWIDRPFLAIAGVVLALDQLTKAIIIDLIGPGASRHSIEVVGDVIRLTYVTNTGAAFGMFQNRTVAFSLIALLAVPILIYINRSFGRATWLTRLCLGMLLGGTLGNLADRVRLGHVVDFVDVGIGALRWPSFNVADSSFVVGVIILAVYLFTQDSASDQPEEGLAAERR